ncbi:hypothetical protein H5410_021317 [Solanum commersonii]|uniref:Uncharacterized protein n=1 Tax=Solanum commersonii TaxID=4109 RepID=A0A9J5ZES7_SOLCO|nr:hypothetical protein H5410_021317 [Solanum commersonii]
MHAASLTPTSPPPPHHRNCTSNITFGPTQPEPFGLRGLSPHLQPRDQLVPASSIKTISSANNIHHGTSSRSTVNSSITKANRKGLRTDPRCTPSQLKCSESPPTALTRVLAPPYMSLIALI